MPVTAPLVALLLAPAQLASQATITPVALVGETVEGVGAITSFTELTVASDGSWAAIANTDFPSSFENSVVLRDGNLVYREGQTLADPAGNILKGLGPLHLDDAGRLTAVFVTVPPFQFDEQVVLVDGVVVKRTGVPAPTGSGPAAGFPVAAIAQARTNVGGQLLTHFSVDDGQTFREALTLSQLDAALNVVGDTYLAWETLPLLSGTGAPAPVEDLVAGPYQNRLAENGVVAFLADLAAPANQEIGAYATTGPIAVEGLPSPVPGRPWVDLAFAPVDLNAAGDTVVVGRIAGDPASDLIVARGNEIVAQSGDPVPGVPGATILNFSQTAPVFVDASGDVLWQGVWLDGGLRRGLFLDQEPLVVEGLTAVGDALVSSLFGFQNGYELSPDGSKLLFRATLDDGTSGLFLLSIDGVLEDLPGCLGNTATSAVVGDPAPGGLLTVTLANGKAAPSLATWWIAVGPVVPGSPCGLPFADAGEVLITLAPEPVPVNLGTYLGAPVSAPLPIPDDPALIGVEVWTQGLFVAPGAAVPLEATNGVRIAFGG